ncbi:hypothetical protein MN608_00310 [Microdochium nivale]|nr:hypothetical protein MN608_00310 [Microdochium nivale]
MCDCAILSLPPNQLLHLLAPRTLAAVASFSFVLRRVAARPKVSLRRTRRNHSASQIKCGFFSICTHASQLTARIELVVAFKRPWYAVSIVLGRFISEVPHRTLLPLRLRCLIRRNSTWLTISYPLPLDSPHHGTRQQHSRV